VIRAKEKVMRKLPLYVAVMVGGACVPFGCSGPTPHEEPQRATLSTESSASLEAFKNADPSLQDLLNKSVGYAIIPDVGKAGFIAGGSYGKGQVYEGGRKVGYADITQATIGLQAGGQTFSELVVFMQQDELNKFKMNQFALSGNVSAVAIKTGAAASADVSKGVIVFTRTKGGLMAEASVGGQRFRFQPLSLSSTQPSGEMSNQ
jgi:lipid-binding SYLF domain-containing protein